MKQSSGNLKDSPWGQEWYVCVIPELMHRKWVTRAVWEHQVPDTVSSSVTIRGIQKVALGMKYWAQQQWQKQWYENPHQLGVIKHFLILFAMLLLDNSLQRLDWRSN